MIRLLLLTWVWLLAGLVSYGQHVDCTTIGFEEGSFRGWERYIGIINDSSQRISYELRPGSEYVGLGVFGHTITDIADGVDALVTEKIPVVAPGSRHSVRLGGPEIGGFVNQIRSKVLVSADKPLLLVQFAIILQNSNHKPYQQAAFSLLIRTPAGDTIPCGYYEASSTNKTAGFTPDPKRSIIYRNWTSSVIDLRPYVGQQLHIEVTTHGCAEGGHFGYAYFDAQCLSAIITPSTFCTSRGAGMTLSAPAGFDQYQWNTGDTTATITIRPQVGDRYWVNVQSRSTLRSDCSVELNLSYQVDQLQVPTVQQVTLCAGESYQVGDSVYRAPGTYQTRIRRTPLPCDSVVITHLNWRPLVSSVQTVTLCEGSQLAVGDSIYRTTGTYQTRVHRGTSLCDSIVTTHLVIAPVELGPMRDTLVMQGDSLQLVAPAPPGGAYTYSWFPREGLSCPSCVITWAKPTQTTRYQLTARLPNVACEASQSVTIQVLPCSLAIPNSFTPNGDGVNDVFTIRANPCLGRIRQLTIYNRWGQVISNQKITSTIDKLLGWDGTFQGETVGTGVYTYQLTIESDAGRISKHSGALTVVR